MFFVWGTRLCGKVDEVPGMFHVATKFGHLWYLPLIPMGSQLVLGETEDGWEGVKIPLSTKSVFMAWLRTALVVAGLWCAFGVVTGFLWSGLLPSLLNAAGAALCAGLFVLSKKAKGINFADLERARDLAQSAGLDQDRLQLLEARFMAMSAATPEPLQPR